MTDHAPAPTVASSPPLSLVQRTAQRYDVEPEKLLATMKSTCFRSEKPITNEQMMALLIVAEQYHLNPFTKELFAFDDKRGGIVPFVSIDGWSRIVNEHPMYDGSTFTYDAQEQAITCTMFRKDRTHPTVVTEYMAECRRGTAPWGSHPRRMLRHKAMVQCARLAFGFAGIYDEDEAQRIRDGGMVQRVDTQASTQRSRLQQVLATGAAHFAPADVSDIAPESSLADLFAELRACQDRDCAGEVLDRGRSLLTDNDYTQLAGAYASAWTEESQP
jgi:phage recombination protein Bet